MKRIDRHVVGPSAPYLWREARKRRYKPVLSPPRVAGMMVPHFHLAGEDRIRIIQEEAREGGQVWSEVSTTINGLPAKVLASRKWGVLMLGDQPFALDQYPLVELGDIKMGPPEGTQPLYEQLTISARYRCTDASPEKLSFEPVQRQHPLGDGRTTELVDIGINLNDEVRKTMGVVNVGDGKDFTLNVQVLAGLEVPADSPGEGAPLGQS